MTILKIYLEHDFIIAYSKDILNLEIYDPLFFIENI
jgi:hypothetical protein